MYIDSKVLLGTVSVVLILECTFITRAFVGKPESENATVFLAKRGVMVPGVPCIRPRKLWTRNATLPACDRIRCFESLASIAQYTFISHTKMSIFFRKGRSSNYILQSQPGRLMLETISSRRITTEPIANIAVKQIILQ